MRANPIDLRQPFRREYGYRVSVGHHATLLQQEQSVTVTTCQTQIMQRRDGRNSFLIDQPAYQVQHLQLVAEVEAGGRLVQQEQSRRLSQRAGERHPLALASGQFRDRALGERQSLRVGHRLTDNGVIPDCLRLPWLQMRIPPHQDDLLRYKPELPDRRLLRHGGNLLGYLTPPVRAQRTAVKEHGSFARRQ